MAYKVYHHEDRRIIVIEGTTETFPERSLVATGDGANITITTFGSGGIVLGPLPFNLFASADGTIPPDYATAFQHVQTELNKVSQGAEVQSFYPFPTAATLWEVNHSFGYKPNVEILDTTNTRIVGCVHHIDDNHLEVSFNTPVAGAVAIT